MAMLPDAIIGAMVGELLRAVLEMKDKAVKFKPTLDRLESTLNSIQPLVNQIDDLNKKLDRPKEETEKLIKHMKNGTELVLKCSKVQWWKFCCRANLQEELEALDEEIGRFFKVQLQGQIARNGLETLVEVKEIKDIVQRNQRVELRGVYCSPPEPPAFTVGLDVLVKELKVGFLRDQVSVSVLTVTGTEGLGKTTLAKKFCWDEQVRGKFKENIFYVTFGKTPKLTTIVQKLYQHNGYQVPEFESDEDAVNQVEHLLKQIGKNPILLVLDDVWPGSESLIDKFVFEIPNYLILVTSRVEITRFGTAPFELKALNEEDALTLFRHSASLNQASSDIPDEVVKKIVKGCCGSPMALTVIGKSLTQKNPVIWHNRARKLSEGHSILNSSSELLDCLQKSIEDLEEKTIECFKDLSLFPENQRIPVAALVDMWVELLGEDEATAMENIFELAYRNLVEIFVTRKVANASDTIDYSYHYVTQHDLLRELAFRQTSQDPIEKRNRLIIDISGNNLPEGWTIQNEHHIEARILSVSTDEAFNSEWCNLQPTEVEVLLLNLRKKKCTLPMFMDKMKKLKVLIITNYDFYCAELQNFELLDYLSNLKRIRLEKVSIPFLSKTGAPLKNLKKISFFMCNVNEAFKDSTTKVSTKLPNLVEMNIDYCDVVELPISISDIVHLKKLSITNCHKFSSLPEEIGNLVNLESLRLSSCTGLEVLPDSITNLHKLKFLDISDCISLSKLPENIGKLVNLEKLNVRGCSGLSELPYSVTDLESLTELICDEETAALWEPFTTILSDLKLEVTQAEINLNWLL